MFLADIGLLSLLEFVDSYNGEGIVLSRIYKPTNGPEDWKEFLAKPDLHWKTGKSARSMAYAWENNNGMPPRVGKILSDAFGASPEPLIVIPEYKVPLPGGRTESQNDAFVFARIGEQTAVIMVEGKVDEPFDRPLSKWFDEASPGKRIRLDYLCKVLGIEANPPQDLMYQLFHRTASAVIEAKRFKADIAIMLVHSFSQEHKWFDDYTAFAAHLGAQAELAALVKCQTSAEVPLYLGWVTGDPKYLAL